MKKLLLFLSFLVGITLAGMSAFAQAPTLSYNGGVPYVYNLNDPAAITPTATGVTGTFATTTTTFASVASTKASVVTYDPVKNAFYAVDYTNGYLNKITTAGTLVTSTGAAGTFATNPINNNAGSGIIVDGLGNIYVSDQVNDDVYEFNPANGAVIRTITGLNNPAGLAVDAANNLYIASSGGGIIYRVAAGATTTKTSFLTGFTTPYGIAINAAGDMYVSQDGAAKNIIKIANAIGGSTTKATFATGFVTNPLNLTFDSFGDLFVPDGANIKMVSPTGTITNTGITGLTTPGQVDFDPAGNMYIADMTKTIKESTVKYYTISAALPTGLTFNTTTGTITGTSATAFGPNTYTITAFNTTSPLGVSTTISLQYKAVPPALVYTNPPAYTYGTTITTLTPANSGGAPTSCTSVPALPTGLVISPTTGAISGKPTAITAGAITYTITANNTSGVPDITTVTITVNPAPLTIAANNQTKVYGAANPALTVTYTGFVNAESSANLTTQPTVSTTAVTGSPVGTYPITAIGAVDPNYTITYTPGTLTVTAKALTITGLTPGNKVYDATTAEPNLTGGTLVGVIAPDVVTLNTSAVFVSPNIGTGVAVTSTSTLSGADAGNYTLSQPAGLKANITAIPLTVTGASANDKVYDGTNAATFTGGTLVGVLPGDVVTLNQTGTFASVNVGANIVVTPTFTLGGAQAGNYTLTQPTGFTANITVKTLTVTGAVANNKVYDGTTAVTFTAGGTLVGVIAADNAFVTLNKSGAFVSSDVANNIAVTTTFSLSGTKAANYILTQPALTANITVKTLTITGLTPSNKVYDRTNTVIAFTGGALVGVIAPDVVSFNASGTFASVNVATGIAVTSTTTLTGADAGNYTLTQPAGLKANITAKALTVSGIVANNKTYNGNTTATLSGGTLVGVIAPDAVTLTQTGTFASANVANGIAVTSTCTIGGAQAGNYTLTQPTGLSANITPAALIVKANNQTRPYGVTITYTVTYTGFITGESSANLTTQPTVASPPLNTAVGVYANSLVPSGAVDNNYTITYQTGNLTITAAGVGVIFDWTGVVSTAWENPLNWDINDVQQTFAYPGSAGNVDVVNIGVNGDLPVITNQPVMSAANLTIASLTFGNNNAPDNNTGGTLGLTVNGFTLAVNGTILQQHSNTGANTGATANGIVTTLQGSGTITCNAFNVGNTTTPDNISNTITRVNIGSTTASTLTVIVNGNMTINSASTGFFIGLGANDAYVSLGAGTLTVNNILLTNSIGGFTFFGTLPYSKLSIDLNNTNSPVLNLLGSNPITISGNTQAANVVDLNNPATPSKTGIVNYAAVSGTQQVYNSNDYGFSTTPAIYSILNMSNASAKTVDGGALTTTSDVNTSGGTVNLKTNAPSVAIGGTWTNSAVVTEGSGAVTVAGALANNVGGTITGNNAAASTTITGAYTNGGTLTCNAENFTFNGNYTNNAGATFTAGAGTVSFSGTAANQTLLDNSTAGSTFNKVFFNGSKQCIMTPGVGNFAVSSTGVLTMGGSETLVAGDTNYPGTSYLTLNSDATGTAAVATITSGTPISGNVNVQRYFHGDGLLAYRNYRFLSSTVHNSVTPVTLGSNTGYAYDLQYLSSSRSDYPITTGSQGVSGGFDKVGNPTIYFYREDRNINNSVFSGGNFIGASNITGTQLTYDVALNPTTSGYLPIGNGFAFYYRGTKDQLVGRTSSPVTNPIYFPNSSTVTQTGFLNQGDVPVYLWFNNNQNTLSYTATNTTTSIGFNLLGNPYACAIDWNTYQAGIGIKHTGTTTPSMWLFNPTNEHYEAYLNGVGTGANTGIISSGQGFFVQTTATGSTLTFTEGAKSVASPTQSSLLMGLPAGQIAVQQLLRLKLAIDTLNYDDIAIAFNSNASTTYNALEDSKYLIGMGPAEGLSSFSSDNVPLAINSLPLPQKDPLIIKLDVEATNSGTLTLKKTQLDAIPAIYEVWLMDKYKKDSLDLRNNANYVFTISKSDTASFGTNRFQVIIRQNQALGVHLLAFNALKVVNGVQNIWKVENEQNYTNFTLERSTDKGVTYNVLDGFLSNAQGTYSYLDKNPGKFTDMYRLKIEDLDGNITYSKVVTIVYSNSGNDNITKNHISIYPNPARSIINLTIGQDIVTTNPNLSGYQTSTMPTLAPSTSAPAASSQSYDIKIINIIGYVVKTATANQSSWQDNVSSLLPGTYIIQVLNHSDKSLVGKSTFVKM